MCADYCALNHEIIKDKYSISVSEELLYELFREKVFSKLDLRSSYHQIRVKDHDIPKIVLGTHESHYEFLIIFFGLTNAPTTFQNLMNCVFKPYLRKFVLIFFDNILVYSQTLQQYVIHLQTV